MSNQTNTEAILLGYLRVHHPNCAQVTAATDIVSSGQLDSLVVLDLVCCVEMQFGIQMLPQDVSPQNMRSIAHLARFIEARTQTRNRAA